MDFFQALTPVCIVVLVLTAPWFSALGPQARGRRVARPRVMALRPHARSRPDAHGKSVAVIVAVSLLLRSARLIELERERSRSSAARSSSAGQYRHHLRAQHERRCETFSEGMDHDLLLRRLFIVVAGR